MIEKIDEELVNKIKEMKEDLQDDLNQLVNNDPRRSLEDCAIKLNQHLGEIEENTDKQITKERQALEEDCEIIIDVIQKIHKQIMRLDDCLKEG